MTSNAKTGQVVTGRSHEGIAAGDGLVPIVAQAGRSREVRATPGWPPVAIPGRPGWYRHLIDGRQVDLHGSEGNAGPCNRGDIATVAGPPNRLANGSRGDIPTAARPLRLIPGGSGDR